MTAVDCADTTRSAVLDEAHVGDIRGALGTIRLDDHAARTTLSAKFKTLLAVVGPGLIVMVGDNDAGAFSTYGQAGQVYGTRLLWTLLLLIPVLYVNQEMVLRLGAVTGVGHARLILSRFGKFWGTFEVIDLFLLNGLTIVTEFIGITLAAGYLGVPRVVAVVLAAGIIVATAFTGSFRAFERVAMFFCAGSLLLVPLAVLAHPSGASVLSGFTIPDLPGGAVSGGSAGGTGTGGMAAVMLLVIGIVGTTIAPWQLFFQQSYVIDKRITPRFMKYEKADLWIGIVVVVVGAAALMGTTAAAFAHSPAGFTDSAGLARGIAAYAGHVAGVLFAVALLDAAVIGAFAVSLSSAYAIGDVLGMKHSLHRGVGQAKGFYALYTALICAAAAIVLIPGSPLGLITEGVQVLAGVLLPAATVFLLMLCNDRAVLGPWVNTPRTNAFTGAVIAVLITLSVVLTASVIVPSITASAIFTIMAACAAAAVAAGGVILARGRRSAA
ncbi:MAG TPA: NRAMP family divalent metal transporter, partial [Trebonia sp.]|nr:NRAMP family divalent metal transporter [Trebonia sp.]